MPARSITLIRHAEKPDRSARIGGVRLDGTADDQELSVRGWQRAGALVRFFAPLSAAAVAPEPPRTIFAAFTKGRSARPLRTVEPLAAALGVSVRTDFSSEEPTERIVAAALACEGPVLVCWRHGTLPLIAQALAGRGQVPDQWSVERFDLAWVFRDAGSGWSFEQVPQQLLPGDRPEPI